MPCVDKGLGLISPDCMVFTRIRLPLFIVGKIKNMPKMPTYFIPHGGGPCFFMDWGPDNPWVKMEQFLKDFPNSFPQKPKAILMISGHWQEQDVTIQTNPAPPMLFDYYGFPDHTYELKFPAGGSVDLAARVGDLLSGAGIKSQTDAARGYDHGAFVPLLVAFPKADIPVIQLSLRADMDAAAHMEIGAALGPLRDEGVVIVGSGMTFHNLPVMMRRMRDPNAVIPNGDRFDTWLRAAVTNPDIHQRSIDLTNWADAPGAQFAHPEAEHLIPLHVVAGAAGDDVGVDILHDTSLGPAQAAFRFG